MLRPTHPARIKSGSPRPPTNPAPYDGFVITGGNANGVSPDDLGGGLFCSSASPTLINCSFLANSAANRGGAASNNNLSSPSFTSCSFQENSANIIGGAIHNQDSSPSLTNCSFQGNAATFSAGAIININSSPALTNCSFQSNVAVQFNGGAILNDASSPSLTNCILWNNAQAGDTAITGASVSNNTSTPSYSHCLIANSQPTNQQCSSAKGSTLTVCDPCVGEPITGVTAHRRQPKRRRRDP